MDNSVQHYLGFGYGLVKGHGSSGPTVLSCQRQGGKIYTLKVQDQAKQAARSGLPI
jgi:hypothetical protein